MMKKDEKIITLTVEEAKHLLCIVMDCKHDHCITQEEAETFREFVKRIEQAEMDEFPYYKNIQEISDYIKRKKEQ